MWSEAKSGLRVQMEPAAPIQAGTTSLRFTLRFHNAGAQDLRIYFLRNPVFRFHSTIYLTDAAGASLIRPQPARPHGIVVTEDEFHLIRPGQALAFEQTVVTDRPLQAGLRYSATWVYENRVRAWPGGTMTLDGPTRPLFGGQDIPHIWLGTIEAQTSFAAR
jgi:hypothetical protein